VNDETREVLASITARLWSVSHNMHALARERNALLTAATKLRTGERVAVVLAELDPDVRWHHVGR
jgi:hypothetical protein